MVNYTHGDLVEVVVLVIQIFKGEELHDVKTSCFLNRSENCFLVTFVSTYGLDTPSGHINMLLRTRFSQTLKTANSNGF
jgi:hypothetical protein